MLPKRGRVRSPRFWQAGGWRAVALSPLGCFWAAGVWLHRAFAKPYRSAIPVICVGNLVVGGTGKTPVSIAIAEYFKEHGGTPHLLSRGYGGSAKGPVLVEPGRHDASQVGDEALLLAASAPTWVGGNRALSARAAEAAGATCLILDDGLQNPTLAKDMSLIVVDGGFGFGNGRLLPAGPLREPIGRGLRRAAGLVLIGQDRTGVADGLAAGLPILRARLAPGPEFSQLKGRRVLAFAGIGRPEKFFESLREAGLEIVGTREFADHHPYRDGEIEALLDEAATLDAVAVTTVKDAMRLPPSLRARVLALPVHIEWEDRAAFEALLHPFLGKKKGAIGPS